MRLLRAPRQAGVAVITVLLVVAIGSALAYALASQQSMVMSQSRHVLVGDALRNLLLGGEVLARQILHEDWEADQDNTPPSDHLNEPWAQAVPPFEVPGGFIEIQVRDMHNCLNLNALETTGPASVNDTGMNRWVKDLFPFVDLDPDFRDRWRDWIDTDGEVFKFGAEDNEYDTREVPFRAANQEAGHISELRLLGEIEFEQFQELRSIACVAPADAKMNANTLPPALVGLFTKKKVDINAGEDSLDAGDHPEWDSVAEFFDDDPDMPSDMDPTLFTLQSSYFEISIRAELDGQTTAMVSTLYRDLSSGNITVLGRDFSRRFESRLKADTEGVN